MLQGGYSQPRGPFIEGVESETEDLKAKKEELERLQAEARAHEEEVKKQIADVKEFEKHQAQLALETERQKAIQEESTVKKDAAQKMKAAKQRALEAKRLEFEKLKKEAEDAEEAARLEEEKAIKETERLNEEREKQKVLERVRHAYEEEEKEKKRLAQQEADRLAAQDAARLEEVRLAKEALDAQNAAMKKAEEEKKQAEALLAKRRREQGERERAELERARLEKEKEKERFRKEQLAKKDKTARDLLPEFEKASDDGSVKSEIKDADVALIMQTIGCTDVEAKRLLQLQQAFDNERAAAKKTSPVTTPNDDEAAAEVKKRKLEADTAAKKEADDAKRRKEEEEEEATKRMIDEENKKRAADIELLDKQMAYFREKTQAAREQAEVLKRASAAGMSSQRTVTWHMLSVGTCIHACRHAWVERFHSWQLRHVFRTSTAERSNEACSSFLQSSHACILAKSNVLSIFLSHAWSFFQLYHLITSLQGTPAAEEAPKTTPPADVKVKISCAHTMYMHV